MRRITNLNFQMGAGKFTAIDGDCYALCFVSSLLAGYSYNTFEEQDCPKMMDGAFSQLKRTSSRKNGKKFIYIKKSKKIC